MAFADQEGNGEGNEESNGCGGIKSHIPLQVSVSQKELASDETDTTRKGANLSKRMRYLQFGSLSSPSVKFQQLAAERDEISRTVPSSSSHAIRERFQKMFSRRLDWESVLKMAKEWIRNPMNMALFVWIICVAVSGAILFLVMTGMLNSALPRKSQRNAWFEVNNQILNALFTLMCLYQHPKRIYHFILLVRWRREDISKLRKVYCKNGMYKPHEWAHMMVVIALLNINCFAQYALCGLNLGYKRSQRPALGVAVCISVAIAAPAFAGVYTIISPLGKDYETDLDEEAQLRNDNDENKQSSYSRRRSLEKKFSFAIRDERQIVESRPMWSGGVFDFWDDISLTYLSLFCSFCVFGWNMERLGFGNMYVHIATFLLFCLAPFWIFNLAAINIDNEVVREVLGITGIFLCMFGLLYGGFWRIQMRKRFNLPPYNFCCGKPSVADCALWLFCCWCSLAQEVRTGNAYDIVEDKFCRKQTDDPMELPILSLPSEDGQLQQRSGPSSPFQSTSSSAQITKANSSSPTRFANSPSPSRFSREYYSPDCHLPSVDEEPSEKGKNEEMIPPVPLVIQREAE